MSYEFADISSSFDLAFAKSMGKGFEEIRDSIEKVGVLLRSKYAGSAFAEVEIANCALERLLVGSIKSGQDWASSFEIYQLRKVNGFQSPVRHYLVLQLLLNSDIPNDVNQDVSSLCQGLKKELEDLKEGCEECLAQLSNKIREI